MTLLLLSDILLADSYYPKMEESEWVLLPFLSPELRKI